MIAGANLGEDLGNFWNKGRRWKREKIVQKEDARERFSVLMDFGGNIKGKKRKDWARPLQKKLGKEAAAGERMILEGDEVYIYMGVFGKNYVLAPQDSFICKLIPIITFDYLFCSFYF